MATEAAQATLRVPVFTNKDAMREYSRQKKAEGGTVALVPTMVTASF